MCRYRSPFLRRALILLSVLLVQALLATNPTYGQASRPTLRIAYVRHGNIWLLDTSTSRRIRLTNDGHDSLPTWTAGGMSLFFQRSSRNRVETMRWLPGRGTEQVRDGLWSPDAAAVAFTRPQSGVQSASTVWVMRNGAIIRATPIEPGFRWAPLAWSPDGSKLALARYAIPPPVPPGRQIPPSSATLWITVGAAGSGHLKQLPMPLLSPGHAGWPDLVVWSPEGRYLTVGVGPDMFCASCRADGWSYSVVPVGGGRTIAVGSGLEPDEALSWAPRDSYLVIAGPAGRETYGDKHLTEVDPKTGSRRATSRDPRYADIEPAVSPDGVHVAFARSRAQSTSASPIPLPLIASRQVYTLDAAGVRPHIHRLTGAPGWAAESPVWSSDGRWIVFVRWHSGSNTPAAAQLWMMRANGTDPRFLTSLDLPVQFLNGFGYYGSFGWKRLFAVAP